MDLLLPKLPVENIYKSHQLSPKEVWFLRDKEGFDFASKNMRLHGHRLCMCIYMCLFSPSPPCNLNLLAALKHIWERVEVSMVLGFYEFHDNC